MKTIIYIIRHARSIANDTGIFAGITDYELSEEGFEQAKDLSLKIKNLEIENIYSSPLKRAIHTIEPTAILMNKNIIIEDGLREMNAGSWENVMYDELRKKFPLENEYIDKTGYFCGMEGQEATEDVAKRMYETIKKLAINNIGKNIIITSHFVAIRAFLCKVMNIPFELTKEKVGYLMNTSITTIIYDNENDKFTVESIGKI